MLNIQTFLKGARQLVFILQNVCIFIYHSAVERTSFKGHKFGPGEMFLKRLHLSLSRKDTYMLGEFVGGT